MRAERTKKNIDVESVVEVEKFGESKQIKGAKMVLIWVCMNAMKWKKQPHHTHNEKHSLYPNANGAEINRKFH